MLPASHPAPILPPPFAPNPGFGGGEGASGPHALADAFSAFIAASGTLERSYRELQGEVAELSRELAARNALLESSLRENEGMRLALQALVDSMPCGVLVLGPKGAIERINPESCALLALPAVSETNGSLPRDLVELERRSGVDLSPFAAQVGESELSFLPRGGSARRWGGVARRWIGLRTRRFTDASGQTRTILILRDITAHKQAEQDREAGRRALALAEVAATLAHEMRNPLASLELFADLLEAEPERTEEWLGHLRAGLRVLGNTVGNALAMQTREAPPLRPVCLGCVVRDAAEFVRPVAEQAGVQMTVSTPNEGAGRPNIQASESALRQVVLNLVTNAVRHTPAGGSVRLAVLPGAANSSVLEVSDTGCGIAPEHLPHIFDAGWSAKGDSTGLGLAVCARIAAQHGATLTVGPRVQSEPGVEPASGACFRMEFPCL